MRLRRGSQGNGHAEKLINCVLADAERKNGNWFLIAPRKPLIVNYV